MAKKKNKRPNLSQETLERARAEMRGERPEAAMTSAEGQSTGKATAAPMKAKQRSAQPLATRRVPTTSELLADYAYVLRDLRNLAILAFVLMAIIVVAALTLPKPTG